MKTINMGLNTEPAWVKADEIIERWKAEGDQTMVNCWENMKNLSLNLRDQIVEAILADGEVSLSWSCSGRTSHQMHAMHWAEAMPEYKFDIGYNYHCVVSMK